MILTKAITLKWNPNNVKLYKDKYSYTKIGDTFTINIEDVSPHCRQKVDCECNQCKKRFTVTLEQVYFDCRCQKCKAKETFIKHYGVDNNMKSKEGLNKHQQTIKTKYNVENVGQIQAVKEKSALTKYKNKSQKTSEQQIRICNLVNGLLNYPICGFNVDILIQNVIIEYDGSGHTISGYNNLEKFYLKEQQHDLQLIEKGYKIIRLISKKDKIQFLSDTYINNLIDISKKFLVHNDYIYINIEEEIIKTIYGDFNLNYFLEGKILTKYIYNKEQHKITDYILDNKTLYINNQKVFLHKISYICKECGIENTITWQKYKSKTSNICHKCTMQLLGTEISKKTKLAMSRPEVKEKHSIAQKKRFANKEERKKSSQRMKKLYETTNLREIVSKKTKEAMKKIDKSELNPMKNMSEEEKQLWLNNNNLILEKARQKIGINKRSSLLNKMSKEQKIITNFLNQHFEEGEMEYFLPIYDDKRKYMFIDYALVKEKIAIEILSDYFHKLFIEYMFGIKPQKVTQRDEERFQEDLNRHNWLINHGWKPFYIISSKIEEFMQTFNKEKFIQKIIDN